MTACVFIHTNHRQMLGAIVGKHALLRNSANTDKFEVRFIELSDAAFMKAREGQLYLRDADRRPWLNDDLQSFTPLRFMPPQLMNFEGRALADEIVLHVDDDQRRTLGMPGFSHLLALRGTSVHCRRCGRNEP